MTINSEKMTGIGDVESEVIADALKVKGEEIVNQIIRDEYGGIGGKELN